MASKVLQIRATTDDQKRIDRLIQSTGLNTASDVMRLALESLEKVELYRKEAIQNNLSEFENLLQAAKKGNNLDLTTDDKATDWWTKNKSKIRT
jgi:Arc/MetJ-type ribon-helix-helix transcriptional regulator